MWPELRLTFRASHDYDVAPFLVVPSVNGTYTYNPSQATVPIDWTEPNAGEIGSSDLLEISFQIASQTATVGYDFCLSNITIN